VFSHFFNTQIVLNQINLVHILAPVLQLMLSSLHVYVSKMIYAIQAIHIQICIHSPPWSDRPKSVIFDYLHHMTVTDSHNNTHSAAKTGTEQKAFQDESQWCDHRPVQPQQRKASKIYEAVQNMSVPLNPVADRLRQIHEDYTRANTLYITGLNKFTKSAAKIQHEWKTVPRLFHFGYK
jgi:hypothetical protein